MTDIGVAFGPQKNLIGVISEPLLSPPKTRPNVVILNKVGPFRMNVDLARRLAQNGFRVLRFDVSGFGESRLRMAKGEGDDIAVTDTRDAMDLLRQRYQAERFVVMGFCAGSDEAHRISVADDRVAGVVHLDGFGYTTREFRARHYAKRLLSWEYMKRKIGAQLTKAPPPQVEAVAINTRRRVFPPQEKIASDYSALMKRGVRLFFLFTRYGDSYVNYTNQIRDAFPTVDFGNRLLVERHPNLGHTFPLVRSREMVNGRIVSWMQREF